MYKRKEKLVVKEIIIQQFWDAKFAITKHLKTTENQPIIIHNFGTLNHAQGPDFLEASIEINGIIHHGAVEIHVKASEWFLHQHQNDEKYNSVVLHVVWKNDEIVTDKTGRLIPVLELKQFFTEKDLHKSQEIIALNGEFPCQFFQKNVPFSEKYQQLTFAYAERLNRKTEDILLLHHKFKGDWQKVIMVQFSKYWMDHQNRNSMIWLAENTSIRRLQRFSKSEMLAYWLGRSQISISRLFKPIEKSNLVENYIFLKRKFEIETPNLPWYFGKIRPSAFPNIRLWQWALWLSKQDSLLSHWLEPKSYLQLIEQLSSSSQYYPNNSEHVELVLNGSQHIQQLIINAVIPIWVTYGKLHHNQQITEHALEILDQIVPENNRITRKMEWLTVMNQSAKHSQQLMAQYECFCKKKKCLECMIGQSYLKDQIKLDL